MIKPKAVLYLILASFFFGLGPVVVKYLMNIGVNSIEIISASTILITFISFFYLVIKRKKIKEISKESWKDLLIIAILATFSGTAGLIYVQGFTSVTNLAFLMKLSVIFVPVIAFSVSGEILPFRKYSIMLFSFFGVFLLTTNGKLIMPNPGDILVIGIAAIVSYTNVLAKKVSCKVDAFTISGIRLFIGHLLLLLFILFSGITLSLSSIDYLPHIIFITVCILGTVFCLFKGIELSTASEATSFFLLSAPIAFIFSYLLIGETIAFIQSIGAVLILICCYLLRR